MELLLQTGIKSTAGDKQLASGGMNLLVFAILEKLQKS